MPKKKNQAKASNNKQQNRGAAPQAPALQAPASQPVQKPPQVETRGPPPLARDYYHPYQSPIQEHYAISHAPGDKRPSYEPVRKPSYEPIREPVREPVREPRPATPKPSPEKMVNVDLSPPRARESREQRHKVPTPERNRHKAAIRHNVNLTDRLYSNVQDVAYQTGFEIHNAYKHPHQIPGRIGNAVMGAASGAKNMGAGLGYAVASEAGEAGMMLVDGCGRLAREAGNSAHRAAKRAARRASNHLLGLQEQDGGMGGGYGTRSENIKRGEAEDEDPCAWPEEEEKPKYKGYY
ncbi:hypothetical protein TWF718_009341 [Orbilia javanica]|uniref:Uncharacterized protein n=1 Tax=Orbilia javanica TaxID=47235 RepID=A0AAN8RCI8_9PEZI